MDKETINDLLALLEGAYGDVLENLAMWQCIAALGVKPSREGNQWCYLYNLDEQESICGFGDTLYDAAHDFYENVKFKKLNGERGTWKD